MLITAHLDHPKWCANDNASGSATILEMARAQGAARREEGSAAPAHDPFHVGAGVLRHDGLRHRAPGGAALRDVGRAAQGEAAGARLRGRQPEPRHDGRGHAEDGLALYITRAPDSVPSFLDALMGDVLAETRAANLSAPTGTHRFWPTELIHLRAGQRSRRLPRARVPAVMLGHDPDWTHHTSEDTVDKTDPSEFRRVGTLALAAGHWDGRGRRGRVAADGGVRGVAPPGRQVERSGQASLGGAKAGQAVLAGRTGATRPSGPAAGGGRGVSGAVDFSMLVPAGTGNGPRRGRSCRSMATSIGSSRRGQEVVDAQDERFSDRGNGCRRSPRSSRWSSRPSTSWMVAGARPRSRRCSQRNIWWSSMGRGWIGSCTYGRPWIS